MDHRQLLNFLSVCEEKSFSNAAKRCFITHQGLSKSIKLLEDEFGVSLFVRTRQGIETTEIGKALRDAILSYMDQHDKIIDMMRRLRDGCERLSIGLTRGYHRFLSPHFFSLFLDTNPDISLDIISFGDKVWHQSMLDYKINIGFVTAPVNESLFESLFFERRKIGLGVGKTHRFSKRGSIKLHELKEEQLVVLNDNPYLIDFCYRNDIKPRVRLGLAEPDLIYDICATGHTGCFMSNLNANLVGLNFVNIENSEICIENYLVANRNTHKSAAAEKFIAYAKEQLPDWNPSGTPPRTEQAVN
jgi:DNA-binding transcriptional LysR family regulator